MGYGRKIYEAAAAEMERRRLLAEGDAERRRSDFYAQYPEARRLREAMAQNAAGAAKAVVAGGDARRELEKLRQRAGELNRQYDGLLRQAGLTREDLAPRYACAQCRDTGFVDGRLCGCFKALQRRLAYERLNLEAPLDQCTFDTFSLEYYQEDSQAAQQMGSILRVCRQYADNFRPGSPSWLFKGGTGLGKTHLSLAIAGKVLEKGYGVIYGSAQTFAVALERERFLRREEGDPDDTHAQLIGCDLLILDDLGTEIASDYVAAGLYDVVNARMLAGRPTIISTNLDMKALEKRYSERFASRITGYYNKLEFLGGDVRVAKRRRRSAHRDAPSPQNGKRPPS